MSRLIDADALKEAIVDYPYGFRGMIYEDINAQPTAEPTEEMVKEYCRKRCLCIMTADLFERLTRSAPTYDCITMRQEDFDALVERVRAAEQALTPTWSEEWTRQ